MPSYQFLESLFEKYRLDLQKFVAYKFGRHLDSEDIVQDTFHNILAVDDVESLENPKAYLYQSASNLALNRIRRAKRHSDYLENTPFEEQSVSLERSVFGELDVKRLNKALANLPEKYRRTFLLSRIQSKTYSQISDELNIAVSTVEKHIIKALNFLKEQTDRGVDQ